MENVGSEDNGKRIEDKTKVAYNACCGDANRACAL